jgi:hypothetical protein
VKSALGSQLFPIPAFDLEVVRSVLDGSQHFISHHYYTLGFVVKNLKVRNCLESQKLIIWVTDLASTTAAIYIHPTQ